MRITGATSARNIWVHKLLVDINVILDVAMLRAVHSPPSQAVLSLIEQKKAQGFVGALSLATIYYLLKKEIHSKEATGYIRKLLQLFSVVEVNRSVIERALTIGTRDLEDGIQAACAEACRADYIVTRDRQGYQEAEVPVITPAEYVATFFTEE